MNQKIKKSDWQRKSRRSFLIAGFSALAGGLGLWWAKNLEEEDEVPWIFRRILAFNEKIWRGLFNQNSVNENPEAPAKGSLARVNSDIGIEEQIDLAGWRLAVSPTPEIEDLSDVRNLNFTMAQIKALPAVEQTEVFKCVEGWSETISYKGVCFSDFLTSLKLGREYKYVGLETPDSNYYVSIDTESMMHPKTVLAYEMNGVPLTLAHGAPLRLIIPVKYGIKNLKRIGRIYFSDERPPDYWTEQGYDWYAAL